MKRSTTRDVSGNEGNLQALSIEVGNAETELTFAQAQVQSEIFNVLTAEQKQKIAERRKQMEARRAEMQKRRQERVSRFRFQFRFGFRFELEPELEPGTLAALLLCLPVMGAFVLFQRRFVITVASAAVLL